MRIRKPCVFFRWRLLGWYVLFIDPGPYHKKELRARKYTFAAPPSYARCGPNGRQGPKEQGLGREDRNYQYNSVSSFVLRKRESRKTVWLDQLDRWADAAFDWLARQAYPEPAAAAAWTGARVGGGTVHAELWNRTASEEPPAEAPRPRPALASLSEADRGWVSEHAGPAVYRRAQQAVATGRIATIERDGEAMSASYTDDISFTIRLWIEDQDLHTDCPFCLDAGQLCLHAAAALLALHRHRSKGADRMEWREIDGDEVEDLPRHRPIGGEDDFEERSRGRLDPITGVPFLPSDTIYVCLNCDTLYHRDSVEYLVQSDGGRCCNCHVRGRMKPLPEGEVHREDLEDMADETIVRACAELGRHLGKAVRFEGRALGLKVSRRGNLKLRFGGSFDPDALTVIVPLESRERQPIDFGLLERCLKDGPCRLAVSGVVQRSALWGYEMIMDDARRVEVL
jgi:hypothetical protein